MKNISNASRESTEFIRALTLSQFRELKASIEDGTNSFFNVDASLVHAYPLDSQFRLYSQRIFLAIIKLTQAIWFKMPPAEREHVLKYRRAIQFQATAAQIHAVLALKSNDFKIIYDCLHQLYGTEFKFDVLSGDGAEKEGIAFSRFIGQYVRLDKGNGIRWEFLSDVLPRIVQPTQWAKLDLNVINKLKTRGALALYCNTARFWGNPSKLTSNRPLKDWIKLLTPSTKSAERFSQDKAYRHFKHRILQPAMQELEALDCCPFTLEKLEDATSRRKVFGLQFRLKPKEGVAASSEESSGQENNPSSETSPKLEESLQKTVEKWGVSEETLENLSTLQTPELIEAIVLTIKEAIAGGASISSPAGAFVKAVKVGYVPTFKLPGKAGRTPYSSADSTQVVDSRQDEQEELILSYNKHRVWVAKEYFESLPEERQLALKSKYFQSPSCDEATREEYLKTLTLQHAMVSFPFFSWLTQESETLAGVTSAQSIEGFLEFKKSS